MSEKLESLTEELGEGTIKIVAHHAVKGYAQHKELAGALEKEKQITQENLPYKERILNSGDDPKDKERLAYYTEVYKQREQKASEAVEDHLAQQRPLAAVFGDVLAEQARLEAEAQGVHINLDQPKE